MNATQINEKMEILLNSIICAKKTETSHFNAEWSLSGLNHPQLETQDGQSV